MEHTAYRLSTGLRCVRCVRKWNPEMVPILEELRVVKREALLGKRCEQCGAAFLEDGPEPKPTTGSALFMSRWRKEVEEGKALPIAGDLFDNEGRAGA